MGRAIDRSAVLRGLERSWSKASAGQWCSDNPACGQCNVTALLIEALYGGVILKTPLAGGHHFYNMIEGERLDFTASQFAEPIAYADLPSCREEAFSAVTEAEYDALKTSYLQAVGRAG